MHFSGLNVHVDNPWEYVFFGRYECSNHWYLCENIGGADIKNSRYLGVQEKTGKSSRE